MNNHKIKGDVVFHSYQTFDSVLWKRSYWIFSNKDISFASRDRSKNFDQGVTTWFCTNRQLISNMATLAIGIGAKVGVGILIKAVPAVMGRVTKKVKYDF